MKSTFIYFGIIVMMFSTKALGNEVNNKSNESQSNTDILKKPAIDFEFNETITLIPISKKSIEEIIAEDRKIIESDLQNTTTSTIEEVIKENNQIIESNTTNEVSPLNFD